MLRNEGTRTLQGVCADVRAKLRANRKGIAYNTLAREQNTLVAKGPGGITDDNINKHRKMRHVEGRKERERDESHQCGLPSCGDQNWPRCHIMLTAVWPGDTKSGEDRSG